jgi:hypothetical protein
MNIELSDQSSEYDAGTIVEVAPIICMKNLINNIQGSYQNVSPDYIPFWNDCLLAILALEAALPSFVLYWTLR